MNKYRFSEESGHFRALNQGDFFYYPALIPIYSKGNFN